MAEPRYHVVLIRPDIAGNTGNIGRSCMALGCRLHLVHPLGFQITDANLKRAGLDYWPLLDLREHESVEAWLGSLGQPPHGADPAGAASASRSWLADADSASLAPEVQPWLFSTKAAETFRPFEVPPGATLVFGSESAGLPEAVLARSPGRARRLAMDPRARSLNLSACVAMVLGSLTLR